MERYGEKIGPGLSDLSRICLDLGAFDLFSDKVCMTGDKFNINITSNGTIEETSEPDLNNCNSDYVLYRIHMPGHVAIALIDILDGVVEIFDSAGINYFSQPIISHFEKKFPDLNIVYVNKVDIQPEPEDKFCQTYILYYVYLRVVEKLSYTEVVSHLQSLITEERLNQIKSFFNYLLSIESQHKSRLDVLPGKVLFNICSQLTDEELSKLLVSSSKAFHTCSSIIHNRIIDSVIKRGSAIELIGPNSEQWILYSDQGMIILRKDEQSFHEINDLESFKKWLHENKFKTGRPLKINK